MTLRVLDSMVRAWTELRRLEPQRKTLPPVVCVIVHHGEHGWTAPVRLHELVEGVGQIPALRELVPDFAIVVDDLVSRSDEALKSRRMGMFPKLVLWALRERVSERLLDNAAYGHARTPCGRPWRSRTRRPRRPIRQRRGGGAGWSAEKRGVPPSTDG